MAVASLVLGILGLPTAGLFLIGAVIGLILGIVALVHANREPHEYGGRGIAIGGIITNAFSFLAIPFIGIVAAIAIPSLLRARVAANEAAAIGDVRTVISAESAYQSANQGFYDTLECLNQPSRCIPSYSPSSPTFLDAPLASSNTVKNGYQRTFYAGAPLLTRTLGMSPSSLQGFAYVAVPVQPGRTGNRAFCGESSGTIYFNTSGSAGGVNNGECDRSSWQPLY